jgi:hypothetical protein
MKMSEVFNEVDVITSIDLRCEKRPFAHGNFTIVSFLGYKEVSPKKFKIVIKAEHYFDELLLDGPARFLKQIKRYGANKIDFGRKFKRSEEEGFYEEIV